MLYRVSGIHSSSTAAMLFSFSKYPATAPFLLSLLRYLTKVKRFSPSLLINLTKMKNPRAIKIDGCRLGYKHNPVIISSFKSGPRAPVSLSLPTTFIKRDAMTQWRTRRRRKDVHKPRPPNMVKWKVDNRSRDAHWSPLIQVQWSINAIEISIYI